MLGIGGEALAGRSKGLMLLDSKLDADTISVPHSVNNLSVSVYDMALAPDSSIWIATNYGIYQTKRPDDDGRFEFKPVIRSASGAYTRIAAAADRLFLYTSSAAIKRGLYCYDLKSGVLTHIDDINAIPITCFLIKDNKLYASCDGAGVLVYDTSTCRQIEHMSTNSDTFRLVSNGVYSLYIDTRDNLYIGYYQYGVQVMSLCRESTFSAYADTAGKPVRTTARNDRYVVTAMLDKVMITDRLKHTTHTLGIDLFDNTQPTCIIPLKDQFALGTFGGGIYMIDPSSLKVSRIDGSHGLRVSDLKLDGKGRLWVASNDGVFRFSDGKLDKTFTNDNSCLKKGIMRIYFDRTGRGWIAGQYGMAAYDPHTDRMRDDVFPDGFINNEFVRCITETPEGDMLFAYDRNKLFRSDSALKNYGRVNHSIPAHNADINILHQLPDSSWLIVTSSAVYSTRDFNDFHIFGPSDGITATIFSPGYAASDDDGLIMLSSNKGLMVAGINSLTAPEAPKQLTISEIRLNGERMDGPLPDLTDGKMSLEIPRNTGTIDIFFTDFASHPDRPDNFEYRLDGDSAWSSLPITRPVSVHYNGKTSRRVEVRPAGMSAASIEIDVFEKSNAFMWVIACAVALCITAAAFAYSRKRRKADTEPSVNETASNGEAAEEADDSKSVSKYRGFKIDDDQMERLAKRLDLLMYDTKIYRRADLKISQLADELGISTAMLSYYFSQHLKSNYYRYLNSYRIKEFKNMVADGTYHTYTLTAMSQMCGFGSRTSFFRYFKEAEGISPLDYIKQAEDGKNQRSK